jgi:hypothetical protein
MTEKEKKPRVTRARIAAALPDGDDAKLAVKCTSREREAARLYANGRSQAEAFCEAYDKAPATDYRTKSKIASHANVVFNRPHVRAQVDLFKAEVRKMDLWDRARSIRVLAAIAEREPEFDKLSGKMVKPGSSDKDKIAAVRELNSMHGFQAKPDGSQTDMGELLSQLIAKLPG